MRRARSLPIFVLLASAAFSVVCARRALAQGDDPAPPSTPAAPTEPSPGPTTAPPPTAPPVTVPTSSGDANTTAPVSADASPARPSSGLLNKAADVFAEDWWSHVRPFVTLHGFFRVRAELFHNFSLGRADPPATALWPRPLDDSYRDASGVSHDVLLCGSNAAAPTPFQNKTQASANMRFRLDPEIHVSDNLRIISQIDLLDNVVLGSTPGWYSSTGSGASGTYLTSNANPYTPRSVDTTTTAVPAAGQNGITNSVSVKRVYGEYMTPLGLLRFGRQPNHWGLGILANAGDTYDSDWQTTVDRIMFTTGVKSLDLYVSGAWDFPHEGAISANAVSGQGQPYDQSQFDDVNQYMLTVMRKRAPELAKRDLANGRAVLNGGLYFNYRKQTLANDTPGTAKQSADPTSFQQGFSRRRAEVFTPDVWGQILYRKFRFEFEAAANLGSVDSAFDQGGVGDYSSGQQFISNGWKIRDFIVATQSELKLVEDKLRLQFGFGLASGDADVQGLGARTTGLLPQKSFDRTFSMGRFHPDYRVDLILFRNILSRVQGAYYFRPSVEYDFLRNVSGQKLGGGAAVIWSRATDFVQAPGHQRDLGLELNATVYYQAKDGSLNDNPDRMGGFYTFIQYGVLFPLGGLGYLSREKSNAADSGVTLDTSAAQTVRWYMGVLF